MQSDPPQGDPRLQRIDPGAPVATGYVDPCIVFLETTLPGEIPLLAACWASSSREIRDPDGKTHWELKHVVVLECRYDRLSFKRDLRWTFAMQKEECLILRHGVPDKKFLGSSYFSTHSEFAPPPIFQWTIRFLDQVSDAELRKNASIRKLLATNHPYDHVPMQAVAKAHKIRQAQIKSLGQKLFRKSKLDWPSIAEILASLEPRQVSSNRPSLVRRLIQLVST
jgi:hypothetical protein